MTPVSCHRISNPVITRRATGHRQWQRNEPIKPGAYHKKRPEQPHAA